MRGFARLREYLFGLSRDNLVLELLQLDNFSRKGFESEVTWWFDGFGVLRESFVQDLSRIHVSQAQRQQCAGYLTNFPSRPASFRLRAFHSRHSLCSSSPHRKLPGIFLPFNTIPSLVSTMWENSIDPKQRLRIVEINSSVFMRLYCS